MRKKMRGISNLTIPFNGLTIQRITNYERASFTRAARAKPWTAGSYLPRYIDKIRLHLAGKLHADYQENLGKGFDGMWLKYAGVTHEQMIEVVKKSITDGEVCDWVRQQREKIPGRKGRARQGHV